MDLKKNGGQTQTSVIEAPGGAHSTAKDPCADVLGRITVVLCRPRHPGNIGAAARAMKTMGLGRLVLVEPERYGEADRIEAQTRASGAGDLLDAARIVPTLDEALNGIVCSVALTARRREIEPPRLGPRETAESLVVQAREGEDVALVFGNETSGLSNEEVMRCDRIVGIPTNPAYGSLNLGSAVQVLAHELRMAALGANAPGPEVLRLSPLATRDEVEGLLRHLEQKMTETGFFDAGNPKRLMPKLRRLFGRAAIERDEVNILRGFLASIVRFDGK